MSNARYNPTNGKRIALDTKLTYAVISPGDPQVAGPAYTNDYQGTTSTKLCALEGRTDTLVEREPPNDGVLEKVAPRGVEVADLAGFDIVSVVGADTVVKNDGFAVVGEGFYTARLTAGIEPALTLVGKIPGATQLRGLSIALQPKWASAAAPQHEQVT